MIKVKKDKIFISLFCYICGLTISQIILNTFVSETNIWAYSFGFIICYLLLISFFILINKAELKAMVKDFKKNYRQHLKAAIFLWLGGFVLMLALNFLVYYVFTSGADINTNEQVVRDQMNELAIAAFIVYNFLAPILEELVFRLGFNAIKNKYLYLTITSSVFASMHILGDLDHLMALLYILPYLALGLTFGLAYQKTNNIFTSMIVHILHNTLTYLIIIFI